MEQNDLHEGEGSPVDVWCDVEINPLTGELRPKPKKRLKSSDYVPKSDASFVRTYRANLQDIVVNEKLDLQELGMLLAIMAFAEWGTNRLVHPKSRQLLSFSELAGLLHMDRKHVARVLWKLHYKGFLYIYEQPKRGSYVMVNAQLMFFGRHMMNSAEHKEAWPRDYCDEKRLEEEVVDDEPDDEVTDDDEKKPKRKFYKPVYKVKYATTTFR